MLKRPRGTGDVSKSAHRTLDAVGSDIEKLAFNKAIARLYDYMNQVAKPLAASAKANDTEKAALKQAAEFLTIMIAPFMPHLAEECWQVLGHDTMVAEASWPDVEVALTKDDEITLPVQINGKRRGEISVAVDADNQSVEASVMALDFVIAALDGKEPRKVVVVRKRIVNVVV